MNFSVEIDADALIVAKIKAEGTFMPSKIC